MLPHTFETYCLDLPIIVTVTSYSPSDPGRFFGPPEDCYPAEPAEIEFDIDYQQEGAAFIDRALDDSSVLADELYEAVLVDYEQLLKDYENGI